DLRIDGRDDRLLRRCDLLARLGGAADDVERTPGQQARDRVEVRRVHVAADAGVLKRDRAPAAERVSDPGAPAEPALTQLRDQFGQRACAGAEVGVDLVPDVIEDRLGQLFRALAVPELLVPAHPGEGLDLDGLALGRATFPGIALLRQL